MSLSGVLDRVRVIDTIGRGTFGYVVLAEDASGSGCPNRYACKIMEKSAMWDMRVVDCLKRELSTMRLLSGKNFFPKFYGVVSVLDKIRIAMEFNVGGDMWNSIKIHGGYTREEIRFYAAEILVALKTLHDMRILYRDLKAENVMFDREGHIKLVDFGLAIPFDSPVKSVVGTLECMAPEVVAGGVYDYKADIWSFGALLYEMAYNRMAFGGHDGDEDCMVRKIMSSTPEIDSSIGGDFADLMGKLFEKDPELRPNHKQIMDHPFFSGISWNDVEEMKLMPPLMSHEKGRCNEKYLRYHEDVSVYYGSSFRKSS